jgi:hypothetical protein
MPPLSISHADLRRLVRVVGEAIQAAARSVSEDVGEGADVQSLETAAAQAARAAAVVRRAA